MKTEIQIMLKILVRTSQNTFLLHYKCRMTNEVTTTKKEKKKLFVEVIIRSTQIPYTVWAECIVHLMCLKCLCLSSRKIRNIPFLVEQNKTSTREM